MRTEQPTEFDIELNKARNKIIEKTSLKVFSSMATESNGLFELSITSQMKTLIKDIPHVFGRTFSSKGKSFDECADQIIIVINS